MANAKSQGRADALLAIAYESGRRVGLNGLPSELVPGRPGSPEHDEALKGWRSGTAHYVAPVRKALSPA